MPLTKSEAHILQAVFGYTTGLVTVPGHDTMRIYKDQARLLRAAESLRRAGVVRIGKDPELPESIILVTATHIRPDPLDEPICCKFATAGLAYKPK